MGRKQEYISIDAKTLTRIGVSRPDFEEDEVLKKLEELGLRKEEQLIKDPIKTNFFSDLLPRDKWYK